jgi:hypothetical protein
MIWILRFVLALLMAFLVSVMALAGCILYSFSPWALGYFVVFVALMMYVLFKMEG